MKRDDVSTVTMIKQNYQKFTEVEKGIANFFLENTETLDFSAKSIADRIFVSVPSLSRFAQKCGYSGYREFIYSYKLNLKKNMDTENSEIYGTLKTYEDLIKEMAVLFDRKQIEHVLDLMIHKERVIVCGKGSSGLSALEMESRFLRVGLKINAITDDEKMHMQAVFMEPGCLVIGMSISGSSKGVKYLLKNAKEKRASTVLITAHPNLEMKAYCDEIIRVPSLPNLDSGNLISPQLPLLIVQDILYYKYKEHNQLQKEFLHNSTLRALKTKEDSE